MYERSFEWFHLAVRQLCDGLGLFVLNIKVNLSYFGSVIIYVAIFETRLLIFI